jgi:hypothetical protein
VGGKQKKFKARPKLKVGGGCFLAHMYVYNMFFEKSFGSFMNVNNFNKSCFLPPTQYAGNTF